MLWFAVVLISVAVGVEGGIKICLRCPRDVDNGLPCFSEKREICEAGSFPDKFPETAEDLLNACHATQEYGNCIADAMESCGLNDENLLDMRNALSYLDSVCREENPLFKVISSNLGCVSRVFMKVGPRPCTHSFSEEGWNKYVDLYRQLTENAESNFRVCLEALTEITCQGATYERHCGAELGDAVAELIANIRDVEKYCSREILEELESPLSIYEKILYEEMSLQDVLEKKRK